MGQDCDQSARRRLPDVMQGRYVFPEPSRYKLSQRIGEGSWAVCYAAKPARGSGKAIAVKCIPRKGLNLRHRSAIKGELDCHRVVSGRHKNILRIVCVEEDVDDDVLYLGTELCIGGNLRHYVEKNVLRGQTAKIKDVFTQILDGLKAMHDSHIYHRDLKPDNIFIKDERTVVIGDFGFATSRRKTSDFGMGTPGYVAPEVIHGIDDSLEEWSSPHGDIWALGIILLDLVTGSEADLGWENAKLSDPAFHYYYFKKDKPFFSVIFEVSKDIEVIFRAIFEADIGKRISLDKLRETVLAIDSFGDGNQKNSERLYHEARLFWREKHSKNSKKRLGVHTHTHAEFSDSESSTLCCRGGDEATHHTNTERTLAVATPTSIQPKPITLTQLRDYYRAEEMRLRTVTAPVRPPRICPVPEQKLEPAPTPAPEANHRIPSTPPESESDEDSDSDGPETPQTNAADDQVAIENVEELALDGTNASGGKLLMKGPTSSTMSLKKLLPKKRPMVGRMQIWIRGAFRGVDLEERVEGRLAQPMA